MLSGALKSVRHAQMLNFASRAAFKSLDPDNASTSPAHIFSPFFVHKAVCFDQLVCEREEKYSTVTPRPSSGKDLKEAMLLSTLITLNAASTWQPPWPLQERLAGLLNKPTINSQTSGQTVFEKVDRFLSAKPPDVSACAGHWDSNKHTRVRDSSREGIA